MGTMDILSITTVMMVSWVHMYVNLIVSFKYVWFIACQLYLKTLKRWLRKIEMIF